MGRWWRYKWITFHPSLTKTSESSFRDCHAIGRLCDNPRRYWSRKNPGFRRETPYGFRPRKSAQQALREIYKWLNFKCHWVVDADLKAYFDTIPHDKLLLSVRSKVIDRSVVKLIEMWLTAGVMEDMRLRRETTGTPQGGVISPLLANLYLHWLDHSWEMKSFGKRPHNAHIVRYADDFVILCKENPEFYLKQGLC
ncbi:hypothetical protein LAW58_23665 [Escherichia coli]|nr:hypothetical protein [Escherichia coli]